MLTYRVHVYSCAMAVTAEATRFALSLSECVATLQAEAKSRVINAVELSDLKTMATSLRSTVDRFSEALSGAGCQEIINQTHLIRHLNFIDHWLDKKTPNKCLQDPVDIASHDLPRVLVLFEEWYELQSPTDIMLSTRLKPHISSGQLNAAIRETWPLFKTRMVEAFRLEAGIDGDRLMGKLFGNNGATAKLLPNHEREGYLNLFKGLYALSRNPVAHNDTPVNPEDTGAVIALVNSALVRIDNARRDSSSMNGDPADLN